MKYKNYIDNSFYLVFNLYLFTCFILSLIIIALHVNRHFVICGIWFLIFTVIFAYFFYARSYYLDKEKLVVKIGFFHKTYLLKNMKKCYITENRNLSYATSRKRLCIELINYSIYISPEKMDEVLLELIKRTGKSHKSGRKKK